MKTMATQKQLVRYEAALIRYAKAQQSNDPLVTKPTREEYGLASADCDWVADLIERKIATNGPK